MFCVECGKEVGSDDELRGGQCVECFLERNPPLLLPHVIDVIRCPTCGAIQERGGWTDMDVERTDEDVGAPMQEAAGQAAEDALEVVDGGRMMSLDLNVHQEAKTAFVVDMVAEVALMGQAVPVQTSTRVRVRGETCPVCSRRAGQYYEAVVQFRGTKDRPAAGPELERARQFMEAEVARLSETSRDIYIVKVEETRGGLDFYLSNQTAAAQLAKRLGSMFSATNSSTSSVVGRREGREVLRITHLVRLPDLRRGDYVDLRGQLLRVQSATKKEATVDVAAGKGKRRHLSRNDRAALELVADAGSVLEAVVVSTSEAEVQVLDPETLRTVDLRVPEGYDISGKETVRVVRWKAQLLLVE